MKYKTSKTLIAALVSQFVLFGCVGDDTPKAKTDNNQKNVEQVVEQFKALQAEATAAGEALTESVQAANVPTVADNKNEDVMMSQLGAAVDYADALWDHVVTYHLYKTFVKDADDLNTIQEHVDTSRDHLYAMRQAAKDAGVKNLPWKGHSRRKKKLDIMRSNIEENFGEIIAERNKKLEPVFKDLSKYAATIKAIEVFEDTNQDQITKVKETFKDAQEQANNMVDLHNRIQELRGKKNAKDTVLFLSGQLEKARDLNLNKKIITEIDEKLTEAKNKAKKKAEKKAEKKAKKKAKNKAENKAEKDNA